MKRRILVNVARIPPLLKDCFLETGFSEKLISLFACLLVTQLLVIFVCVLRATAFHQRLVTAAAHLAPCPDTPPYLVGPIEVQYASPTFRTIEQLHPELDVGGFWRPDNCSAIHQVALVIPFRGRDLHLRTFLYNMHPFLQRQHLDYGIYVVEQASSNSFNRGMLMNIGFVEAMKQRKWKCFIFHDVDLLPENDRNMYSCPELPRHMSVAVDTMAYRLMYDNLFGGIEAFRTEHFELVNGFSNKFFGWGGEDDDLYERITNRGLNLTRYSRQIARYRMLSHVRSNPNAHGSSLLKTSKYRMETDGLNSLESGYVAKVERKPLYTLIYADINQKYIAAH